MLQFGRQLDIQGLLGGIPDADRRVGYLSKYPSRASCQVGTGWPVSGSTSVKCSSSDTGSRSPA